MFASISIDDFVESYTRDNPEDGNPDIREALAAAADAKRNGAKCHICGQSIWAVGTAIVGWNGCFTCISGEADNSDDYEIDGVCF
jgi:hypothetical protein